MTCRLWLVTCQSRDACAGLRQGVAFNHGHGDIIFVLVVNHCRTPRWQFASPQSLSTSLSRETGWDVLDWERREQKAQTLVNLGGQVERALAALRAFDAAAMEPTGKTGVVQCWMRPRTGSGPS